MTSKDEAGILYPRYIWALTFATIVAIALVLLLYRVPNLDSAIVTGKSENNIHVMLEAGWIPKGASAVDIENPEVHNVAIQDSSADAQSRFPGYEAYEIDLPSSITDNIAVGSQLAISIGDITLGEKFWAQINEWIETQ